MKIINPDRKSDYMTLTWHRMSEKFESPTQLKLKLIESFPQYVPPSSDFNVGYLEGRGCQKRWVVCGDDLEAMYKSFFDGDEIHLWCDGKGTGSSKQKRKNEADDTTCTTAKKHSSEEQDRETFEKLKKKHGSNFSDPQLQLWARLLRRGVHQSDDEPPDIPLMKGPKSSCKKKSSDLTEALTSAATTLATALKSPSSASGPSTPVKPKSVTPSSFGVSPNSRATLRRRHFEDLKTLKNLYEDCALTNEEYEQQKEAILKDLNDLKS